ncbi:uncharacterized protein [Setaria viridis]|uniref:uncharacterized protein n=1 Tax=Setaria viridis TaxID=4556 RepID=UPI003B3A647A
MAREVHGPDFDSSSEDIDGEIVMRVGGGKKHGRYWIGDGVINTASTATLSQIQARSTDSSPAIRLRPTIGQFQMEALQAQVEAARKQQEEMAARMEQMVQRRLEAERQRMEEENRMRMDQMFQYMQNFASSMGQSLPPPSMLFPPPQPPTTTPNQSAASNNEDQDLSQWSPWPPWI